MKLFKFNKEIILITGASGFLGLQYTDFFCKLGSKVFAIDIVKNKKITILEKRYKNLKFHFCDMMGRFKGSVGRRAIAKCRVETDIARDFVPNLRRTIGDGFFGGPVIFGGHVGELDPP